MASPGTGGGVQGAPCPLCKTERDLDGGDAAPPWALPLWDPPSLLDGQRACRGSLAGRCSLCRRTRVSLRDLRGPATVLLARGPVRCLGHDPHAVFPGGLQRPPRLPDRLRPEGRHAGGAGACWPHPCHPCSVRLREPPRAPERAWGVRAASQAVAAWPGPRSCHLLQGCPFQQA